MPMRISTVGQLKVVSLQFGSILQAGDCVVIAPRSEVLAVQRQVPVYQGDEGGFDSFRTFRQPIPEVAVDEAFSLTIRNDSPYVTVGSVDIIGISAASVLQIGSSKVVDSENRTLHIRQLARGRRPVGVPPALEAADGGGNGDEEDIEGVEGDEGNEA